MPSVRHFCCHPCVSYLCCAGGRGLEPQCIVPRGQRGGVHAAPHPPGGCRQAETHLHEEIFRVRSGNTQHGGGVLKPEIWYVWFAMACCTCCTSIAATAVYEYVGPLFRALLKGRGQLLQLQQQLLCVNTRRSWILYPNFRHIVSKASFVCPYTSPGIPVFVVMVFETKRFKASTIEIIYTISIYFSCIEFFSTIKLNALSQRVKYDFKIEKCQLLLRLKMELGQLLDAGVHVGH